MTDLQIIADQTIDFIVDEILGKLLERLPEEVLLENLDDDLANALADKLGNSIYDLARESYRLGQNNTEPPSLKDSEPEMEIPCELPTEISEPS